MPKNLVLILGSCQFPADIMRLRVASRTLSNINGLLDTRFNRRDNTVIALMAGDTIYADATAGLFDAKDEVSRYQNVYEVYEKNHQKLQLNTRQVTFIHTIDDHEIIDNWEPPVSDDMMLVGKKHFIKSVHDGAASLSDSAIEDIIKCQDSIRDYPLWRHVLHEQRPIFLMDTRTERQERNTNNINHSEMISKAQMNALLDWLDDLHEVDKNNVNGILQPKFILSGSMLLPRHLHIAQNQDNSISCLHSDSWDGYPATLEKVLSHISKQDIKNVIFMSGDAHIPAYAKIELKNKETSTIAHSIHAPPFYAPLPFANASASDFTIDDSFTIQNNESETPIEVTVHSVFPEAGDGYAVLNLPSKNPNVIAIEFHSRDDIFKLDILLN